MLSSLEIAGLTLYPDFDPEITEYTALTHDESNEIIAKPFYTSGKYWKSTAIACPEGTLQISSDDPDEPDEISVEWGKDQLNYLTVRHDSAQGANDGITYTVVVTHESA